MSTMLFNILIVSTFEALEKASMVPLVHRMVANARPRVGCSDWRRLEIAEAWGEEVVLTLVRRGQYHS
jgi:hypothetical protein